MPNGQGHVFLKGEGVTPFLFNFFKVDHFYILKLLYPLQNCVIQKKVVSIILWKKVMLSCLKMNLKKSHT